MAKTIGEVRGSTSKAQKVTLSIEDRAKLKIETIIKNIQDKGYSKLQPFSIGSVEQRMKDFATTNNIELGSNEVYMSSKQIAHTFRNNKEEKGISISADDLADFAKKRTSMDIYYDKEDMAFVYTDHINKFIVRPNYELKINRVKTKIVNYITATKMSNNNEFILSKYIKI